MSIHLNRVVLVTGASSGIGASIAQKFVSEGAKVVMVARDEKKLNNVFEICKTVGAAPLTVLADITKDKEAERAVNVTIEHFGKLDVLINNAGIVGGKTGLLYENATELFDKVCDINVRAAVHLSKLSAPHLVEAKGNIINVSSIAARCPISLNFPYCTSKAALEHFTKCAAYNLGPHGVRVNCVAPGPTLSDIIKNMGKPELEEQMFTSMMKTTVLNRVCDPEEVADLVSYVASEKGKGITGAVLLIDNGASLKGCK